jgi:hypothetical protein
LLCNYIINETDELKVKMLIDLFANESCAWDNEVDGIMHIIDIHAKRYIAYSDITRRFNNLKDSINRALEDAECPF